MNKFVIEIIDDEASLRNALSDKLIGEGFEVLLAPNGKEGMDIALSKHPDLILMDIVMPVMDGTQLIEALKKDAWGKSMVDGGKIIILSNLENTKNLTDYFVKSDIALKTIVDTIKEKLK